MTASMILDEICYLLESYKGRDKILRTLSYTTKLIGAFQSDENIKKKFNIFASQMSKTRATLRLFDDLPMLKYSLEYGLGESEPDSLMATLGVTNNIIDQIFYPIEKVSWLAEYNIISTNGEPWDVASSICWVATVYLNFIKTLRYFCILKKAKTNFQLEGKSDEVARIIQEEKTHIVTCARLVLDFVHAVQTLPKGFLWSSKLNTWQVGLIGTLSSVLGIYQIFAKKYASKS